MPLRIWPLPPTISVKPKALAPESAKVSLAKLQLLRALLEDFGP